MKKGDASMVATVLLIVMAIVIAVLVASFSRESEKKMEEKIINLGSTIECQDVGLGVSMGQNNKLILTNRGTLGIDKVVLRKYGELGTVKIETFSSWTGGSKLYPKISQPYGEVIFDKIEFIPVIIINNDELGCENKIVTWVRT